MALKSGVYQAYYVLETQGTPGAMVTNPALKFLGHATVARPSPKPNNMKLHAAGEKDYTTIYQMSLKPRISLNTYLANVDFLTDVMDNKYFSLVLWEDVDRDGTQEAGDAVIQFLGSKINSIDLNPRIDEFLALNIDIESFSTNLNQVTIGSGSFEAPTTNYIDFSKVEISKGGSVVTDWTEATSSIQNNLIRRLKPSDKTTRALESVKRDNSFSYLRDMEDADEMTEYSNILSDTAFDWYIKITNAHNSNWFKVLHDDAKFDDFDANVVDPEDIIGKRLTGSGKDIVYSNGS